MVTLNDILTNLNDIVVVKDNNGNIIYNNKDYGEFVNAINENKIGEIYSQQSNNWFNITNMPFGIGDGAYSVVTIKNITKYKEREKILYDKGMCDDLTGLYNRQGIICGLNKFIEDFSKSKKPFTVIMGDIDYFKQVNDTHGHLAGDKILLEVGNILKRSIRDSDFVGRYGGEEFIIILTSNNLPQIKKRIEQIRKLVERYTFSYKDTPINLTMTFGVQTYDGSNTIEQVIEQADISLYYGKEHGRNQIIIYDNIKDEIDKSKSFKKRD